MNKVTVKINNITFSDFETICIRKSMDELSGVAAFTTADFYRQSQRKWDVFLGQSFDAYIGKTLFIRGFVDEIQSEYNKNSGTVTIIGRDNTSVLLDDWDDPINEWKKQTIISLISIICSGFGISVTADISASSLMTKMIESFKINEGESAFEAIKRICIENSILPISYGDGKLTLSGATSNRLSHDSIVLGDNVESAFAKHSNVDRYHSYIVKGYGKSNDFKTPFDYLQPKGTVIDSVITNTKRKKVHLSDAEVDFGKAQNQAKFIRNLHAGKSRSIYYTINDWKQSNGELWKTNSLVKVSDSFLRIQKQMLISDVEFVYDAGEGEVTNICVVDKNTYTNNDTIIKSGFDI